MKRVFSAVIAVIMAFTACYADENRAYFPAVLMYHDIKPVPLNTFDATPEIFASQLDWLKDNGYETLSLEDFLSFMESGNYPGKSVLITFDDGYSGIYDYAFPELVKRNMKAAFFLVTSTIGKTNGTYPHITREQLREIAASENISIGSHTVSHSHLDTLGHDAMTYELVESKLKLEAMTGRKIRALAYPYGDYDGAVIEAAKSSGYEAGFAVGDKGLHGEKARWSIPRIYTGLELAGNDNALFAEYVRTYREMPAGAFIDRWKPIK